MLPPSKPKRFQFVNIDRPEQSTQAKTQKLVRRHVMQQHLHKRLAKQSRQNEIRANDEDDEDTSGGVLRACSRLRDVPTPSSMCTCFGNFEDAIAFSRRSGQLLAVEDCLNCGRPLLTHAELDRGPQTDSQGMIRAQLPANPVVRLGAGKADPFASYSVSMDGYMHGLMDHLLSVMTPAISPVDVKYGSRTHLDKSFNFMVSDAAVLHASLAVASMHYDFCRGRKTLAYTTAFHRGEAIRLVNEMLENEDRAISDEMIASVVRLSSFETFAGDHQGWLSHANALAEIVRRRGGLQNLGYIKRQCYEADIMGSMIGGTKPVFSPVPEYELTNQPIFPIDMLATSPPTLLPGGIALLSNTGFCNVVSAGYLTPPMIQTLYQMRCLIADLQTIENSKAFSPEMLLFTTKRTLTDSIEYPLLLLKISPSTTPQRTPTPPGPTASSSPISYLPVQDSEPDLGFIEEPIRLTALIFSNRVFRNHPPSSGVHTSLLIQLQFALQQTALVTGDPPHSCCWEPHSAVLLWICVMAGGVAARGNSRPEMRRWFKDLLRDACTVLKIESWEVCRWLLDTFLWHNARLDEAGLAFWNEKEDVLDIGE